MVCSDGPEGAGAGLNMHGYIVTDVTTVRSWCAHFGVDIYWTKPNPQAPPLH